MNWIPEQEEMRTHLRGTEKTGVIWAEVENGWYTLLYGCWECPTQGRVRISAWKISQATCIISASCVEVSINDTVLWNALMCAHTHTQSSVYRAIGILCIPPRTELRAGLQEMVNKELLIDSWRGGIFSAIKQILMSTLSTMLVSRELGWISGFHWAGTARPKPQIATMLDTSYCSNTV